MGPSCSPESPPPIPSTLNCELGKLLLQWRRWRSWVGGEACEKGSEALQTEAWLGQLLSLSIELEEALLTHTGMLLQQCQSYYELCLCACVLSHVPLFAAPWTAAPRLLYLWNSPGKNTGVGCHFLLQGIFPTMEPMFSCVSCIFRWIPLPLASPGKVIWIIGRIE